MPWDEEAFQRRIRQAAQQREMSLAELFRKAGVDGGTFNEDKRPGAQGRTYNTVEAIAEAAGLSVAEALGAISLERLELAVNCAVEAYSTRPELLADAIVSAYDVLTEMEKTSEIGEAVKSTVIAMLKRQGKRR